MDELRPVYNQKKLEYNLEYKKEKQKRIPLDIKRDYFENTLKPAAAAAGEPVNTFIKKAIAERIEKMNI